MGYLFLIIALILNSIANFLMKIGSKKIYLFKELSFIDAVSNNYILFFGLILFALNLIFYTLALSKINLSIAYTVMVGGGLLIINLVSFLYLKESFSFLQLIGFFLILVGVTLISLKF